MRTEFKRMFRMVATSAEWRAWYKRLKARGERRAARVDLRRGRVPVPVPDGVRLNAWDVG